LAFGSKKFQMQWRARICRTRKKAKRKLIPRDLPVRVYIGARLYKLKNFILKRFQIVVNKPETASAKILLEIFAEL